jgi:methionyl-tRNA formyltransferase
MGSPDFSVPALRALAEAGAAIAAVYCQPPKAQGRGQKLHKTPVHLAAETMGFEVRTPKSLRDPAEQAFLRALAPDAIIVAAYGLLLPQAVLDIPRLGCLNIHASLLPRWRGAAPIQRAILAGDKESGVAIMQMEAGLDTGPVWAAARTPITGRTTAATLHDALAGLGAKLLIPTLAAIAEGKGHAVPQTEEGMTYAAKLTKEDGRIDWTQSAEAIDRRIRALTPWPGCFFTMKGETVKILEAEIAEGEGPPAALLGKDCRIACGQGALRLLALQRPGKAPVPGPAFLNGQRLGVGDRLA